MVESCPAFSVGWSAVFRSRTSPSVRGSAAWCAASLRLAERSGDYYSGLRPLCHQVV